MRHENPRDVLVRIDPKRVNLKLIPKAQPFGFREVLPSGRYEAFPRDAGRTSLERATRARILTDGAFFMDDTGDFFERVENHYVFEIAVSIPIVFNTGPPIPIIKNSLVYNTVVSK